MQAKNLDRLQLAFMTYDGNCDGLITPKEFTIVLRAYGFNLSQSESSNYIKQIEKDPRGNITFKNLSDFMLDKMDSFDSPEDIVDAFRTFDMEEKGFINVSELRHVLMNYGEKLSEKEMKEFTKAAQADANGDVDYREFVKRMQK